MIPTYAPGQELATPVSHELNRAAATFLPRTPREVAQMLGAGDLDKRSKQRAAVVKQMSEAAGVSRREINRYIKQTEGAQKRNAPAEKMDKLRELASSQAKAAFARVASRRGIKVDLDGEMQDPSGNLKHISPKTVTIPPSARLNSALASWIRGDMTLLSQSFDEAYRWAWDESAGNSWESGDGELEDFQIISIDSIHIQLA